MAGTWTDPRTWVDGETPTGAQFNTHIRDNLNYLKSNPSFEGDVAVQGGMNATGDVAVGDDLTVVDDATIGGDVQVNGGVTVNDVLTANGSVNLGDAPADIVNVKGTVVGAPLKTYTETQSAPAIAGGALTLDCALGTYFAVALNANCVVAITNPPAAGRALGLVVVFAGDGTQRTITWPASVVWPAGSVPTMTPTAGKRDMVTLITYDGGTTWFAILVGQKF